jgi:hypothetical protein
MSSKDAAGKFLQDISIQAAQANYHYSGNYF